MAVEAARRNATASMGANAAAAAAAAVAADNRGNPEAGQKGRGGHGGAPQAVAAHAHRSPPSQEVAAHLPTHATAAVAQPL